MEKKSNTYQDVGPKEPPKYDNLANLLAEQHVLGAIMIDNPSIRHTRGRVVPDSFFYLKNRLVFQVMLELAEKGSAIDPLTVEDALKAKTGEWDIVGSDYLGELPYRMEYWTSCNIDHHIGIVAQKDEARRLAASIYAAQEAVINGQPPAEVLRDIADRALEVQQQNDRPKGLAPLLDQIEKYQTGDTTPLLDLNMEAFRRVYPSMSDLVVIAARPSVGKTALAIQLTNRMSLQKIPLLFLSIEMNEPTIQLRRLANVSLVPITRMKQRGGLSREDWDSMGRAFETLNKQPLEIQDGGFSIGQVMTEIRRQYTLRQIKAVFIDHLGLMQLPKSERRDLQIGEATRSLARLAKDLNIVVFLLCQLNRESDKGETKKPRLANLRDSGRIEEDADVVWLLDREMDIRVEDKVFEITIAKNRNGPLDKVLLDFHPESGQFTERLGPKGDEDGRYN